MSTVDTLIKAEEVVNQGIVKGVSVGSRFDASLIAPNIAEGELRFLKNFINAEFFADLLAEKNTTPCNYNIDIGAIVEAFPTNAAYETLWTQWLFPYLSKTSLFESMNGIVIQISSNGAFLNNTTFGESIGIKGLKQVKDDMLQSIEGTQPHIIKFLCDNKKDYPLWDSTVYCSDCDNSKTKTGRNAGFVLK